MKAKDKGYQLYEKFFVITPEDLTNDECVEFSKKCALIAVEELIKETSFEVPNIRQRYWQEVKQEILKL
jgi:hypothetical protein